MPILTLGQPLQGTAAAGDTLPYTIELRGGLQYRIDLDDIDYLMYLAAFSTILGDPIDAGLRIYDAGQPHMQLRGGLMQDAALGFTDARTAGPLYFTPPADGTYEIDVSLAHAARFKLAVQAPALEQTYSRAPSEVAGLFAGTGGNDLIELGGFGRAINFSALGSPNATVSGGRGFDVLVADDVDVNWLDKVVVMRADGANLGPDATGLYLAGQYKPVTANSTSGFLDQVLVKVQLDSVEAVQFADRVVYTLTAEQAQVARLYEGALGRAPEIAGLAYQLDLLARGVTLHDIAHGFLASAEYGSVVRTHSVEGFITSVYQNALHREPEAGGMAYWQATMAGGASSEAVLVGISNSAEAQALWGALIVQA